MKATFKIFTICAFMFITLSNAFGQRYYIRERPIIPAYNHPPRPYPQAVWVESEWVWRHGGYVHVPGYWTRPPRPAAIWMGGAWYPHRRGYYWHPGHWR